MSRSVGQLSGNVVVTSREVKIAHLIDQALERSIDTKLIQRDFSDKYFDQLVDRHLIEWAIYLEAKAFSATQVDPGEILKLQQSVGSKLDSMAIWKSLSVEPSELREMLERGKISRNFRKFKIESSFIQVSEGDVRDYYDKNRARFGNAPFEAFRNNISTFLRRRQIEDRLANWFEGLKIKYSIRK